MRMDREAYKRGLLIGLVGAVLTLMGDFLLGANPAAGVTTGVAMVDMFADAFSNSDLRMVLGGMCGAIGIPMSGVGYYQLGQLLKREKGTMLWLYQAAVLAFTGLAGAGTHVSCAVIPLLYKWIAGSDPELAAAVAEKYASCFMMPMTVIFGVLLFAALAWQAVVIARGRTIYPSYAVFYNMVFGVIAAYVLACIIGNNAVGNGIGTGAISIGHIWMFGMMLWKLPQEQRADARQP